MTPGLRAHRAQCAPGKTPLPLHSEGENQRWARLAPRGKLTMIGEKVHIRVDHHFDKADKVDLGTPAKY